MRSRWFFITNSLAVIAIVSMLLITCNSKQDIKVKSGYKLVWNDEFNYTGQPDSTKWNYDTIGNSWGWGNHELQYYTICREANANVSDGKLKINTMKEDYKGFGYTSARLTTKGKGDWLYGRFEVRAKLPYGRGLWPAIWLLPTDWEYGGWPQSGEIDIMENVGYDPEKIVASVHTASYNHTIQTQKNSTVEIKGNSEVFHLYAIEWNEKKIDAYIDDSLYFTFPKESDDPNVWPFNKRFHLLLNVAIGGDWGGLMGVDDSVFPEAMEIDYVRVFKKK